MNNEEGIAMEITGKCASYQYVLAGEIHESPSLAIGLSGLELSSADSFAYSFGRSIASSAVSACLGMLASKSGLGGFISTIAASMAGSYTTNPIDETAGKPTKISETSRISFEHNGTGLQAINTGFNQNELNDSIEQKERIDLALLVLKAEIFPTDFSDLLVKKFAKK